MTSLSKHQQQPAMVQWPAAIPSSPSNFRLYSGGPAAAPVVVSSQNSNHAILTRSQSGGGGGNGSTAGGTPSSKFQRAYAFDEQRRPSVMVGDAFDLDEIERERRRSHASLFAGIGSGTGAGGGTVNTSPVVKINGTGVTASNNLGGVGVAGGGSSQKAANNNRDHYDMINGTAV